MVKCIQALYQSDGTSPQTFGVLRSAACQYYFLLKRKPRCRYRGCPVRYPYPTGVEWICQVNLQDYQLPTTVTTKANFVSPAVTRVTTVPYKGENYAKIDALYDSVSDLVNESFKAWYCKQFQVLGADTVRQCAAIARQEARNDKRKYFSYLLKNYKERT